MKTLILAIFLFVSCPKSKAQQDGYVDLNDVILVYLDSQFYASGDRATDLNGDNFVDLTDLLIVLNNARNFVQARTPLTE